jgi:hypothetical protein
MQKLNKKSVFFTYVAITLSALIVLSFGISTSYRLRDKMYVVETRINSINGFINDVEKDLDRGMYIAGYRSLLALGEYITTNGIFLEDVNLYFKEALLEGTVNGSYMNVITNSSFKDWTSKIETEARKIGIIINFTIENVTIYQVNPWYVSVDLNISFNVSDEKRTASWERNDYLTTTIDIEGLEDPLYPLNTYGRVFNTITKSSVTQFNITYLKEHLNNSYYIASSLAPSFLMRLQNDLSSSPYGIESLVNLNKLAQQEVPTYYKSNVDYIYFGDLSVNSCIVNETVYDPDFNWFRLDSPHLNIYNVNCWD